MNAKRHTAVALTLQVCTGLEKAAALTPFCTHKASTLATPSPSSSPRGSPSRAQGNGRKERPFKGGGEEKAFGEARARALFPLAFIVRGVFGEEDRVVSQGLCQAGQRETREKRMVRRHPQNSMGQGGLRTWARPPSAARSGGSL